MRKRKKTRYHHGSLHNELLTEAAQIIKHQGLEALSLRKLAKQCHVSNTALYRHFVDKNDLVFAVISRGYALLLQTLNVVIETCSDNTIDCLKALGNAYIYFAQQHQNFFCIMYNNTLTRRYTEQLDDIAHEVYGLLKKQIVIGIKNNTLRNDDADIITFSMWAYLHGITMLMLQGKAENLVKTTTKSFVNHLMGYLHTGIAPLHQGENYD